MKIKRISLSSDEYYGHFSARDFEFDTGKLVVLHGPNESGKSTFLNLMRDLLFGIRPNSQYMFKSSRSDMQMRAELELNAARTGDSPRLLEITRRKGNKNVLTGRFANGETVDEARFQKLLDLPDRNEYENVFGFTQAILSGDLPSDRNGSLAQVLYSTAFPMGGITELKRQLREETDGFFTPQGRTKTLNVNIDRIKSLNAGFEEKKVDRGQYVELEKRLESQSREIEQLDNTLAGKEREKRRLEKLQKSRPHYMTLKRNRVRLAELDASNPRAVAFPANGETEYDHLTKGIAECETVIGANADSMTQSTLQIETLKRQCHEGVLKIAVSLKRLADRKSAYDSHVGQLPGRREGLETVGQEIETLLKRLSPNAKLETTVERSVTDATLAELESLQKRLRGISQKITGHESKLELLQSRLAEQEIAQNQQAATLQTADIAEDDRQRIEVLASHSRQYETDCGRLRDLESQRNQLGGEIGETLAKLARRLGLGEIANTDDMPVLRQFPGENVIADHAAELDGLRQNLAACEKEIAEYAEKSAACERGIAKLDTGGGRPPTREEVRAERENRDRVWRHFRRRYFEADASPEIEAESFDETPTPESYGRLVRAADDMADLRFERVNDVRRLEELLKDRDAFRQRVDDLRSEHTAARERLDRAMGEWLALWPGCDAELVKRPAAMQETRRDWEQWQQLRRQLRNVVAAAESVQSEKADFERRATELAAKFSSHMTFGQAAPNGKIAWDASEATALCRSLEQAVARQDEHRRQAAQCRENTAATQREIETARTAMTAENERFDEATQRAQQLAANIGLFDATNGGSDGRAVDELIDGMLNGCRLVRSIQQEHRKYCREQKQLTEIETQVRRFEEDADAALLAVAWDAGVASMTTIERLAHALMLLDQSQKATAEIQTLESQLTVFGGVDRAEREKLASLQGRRQTLLETVGAVDETAFRALATAAAERRQCAEQIARSQEQLLTISDMPELPPWESELEQWFDGGDERPDLDALLESGETECRELRAELDALRDAKGATGQVLADLRKSEGAAETAEQIEFARQELLENINRFVPRLLALRTLDHAIETFERERQPETLKQICEYFAAMTGGRYTRVGTRIGGDGKLVVFENDGTEKTVDQLSTGTREQLHLAVRLAYIGNFCKTREPLPIVLDDVLVNFDPARQQATLRFLGELSRQMQIIFLTCHRATIDAACESVPELQLISL